MESGNALVFAKLNDSSISARTDLSICAASDSSNIPEGEELTVVVELDNYSFNPRRFNVSVGDRIDFTLISLDELHTFTIEELDINWAVSSQEPEKQRFTFDQPGTYELVCIIPPHEGLGMIGTVTVR